MPSHQIGVNTHENSEVGYLRSVPEFQEKRVLSSYDVVASPPFPTLYVRNKGLLLGSR